MMRALFIFFIAGFAVPAHAADFWSRLWRNADQQGEALLRQGDAAGAAKTYSDPRRKAYAKLQAGDYQGAAQDLQDLHESDDDYNRGNALAYAGNLQEALEAYDAALKTNPNNQDARHNRELVENALKQQQGKQKSGDDKSQDGKQDEKQGDKGEGQQGKDSPEAGKQGEQSGQDKSGKQPEKDQGSASQNKQDQQGKAGGQALQGKPQEGKQQEEKTGQAGKAGEQSPAKDEAEQARRDAEASLAQRGKEAKESAGADGEEKAGTMLQPAAPKSEKQIAQEQWLRSIPDDPGGLLRRKFMIEHMMRQQKAKK